MNIFMLSSDPAEAAEYHCDKHVVKMILESAQLLSTAHRVLDGTQYIDASSGRRIKRWKLEDPRFENALYKATHINHPSNIWAREAEDNYVWLWDLFYHLNLVYTRRYEKTHATWTRLGVLLSYPPINIPQGSTVPRLAMPPEFQRKLHTMEEAVEAYRSYYVYKYTEVGIDMRYNGERNMPAWFSIV